MSDITVHPSSVETVHLPVRDNHPINGDVTLSALTVEVALPVDGVAPTVWVTTAWETGTWLAPDGYRYYLAKILLGDDFTLVDGTTYQAYARVTVTGTDKAYVKGGRVQADST